MSGRYYRVKATLTHGREWHAGAKLDWDKAEEQAERWRRECGDQLLELGIQVYEMAPVWMNLETNSVEGGRVRLADYIPLPAVSPDSYPSRYPQNTPSIPPIGGMAEKPDGTRP